MQTIVLQYSPMDNIFIASIPQLQGCVVKKKTPELALLTLYHALKVYREHFPECAGWSNLRKNNVNAELWLVFGFIVNIITVLLLVIQTRTKLENRLTACETYLKIIIRHLDIDLRQDDIEW